MIVCEVYVTDNCILITKSVGKLNVKFHKILCFMREKQYPSSQLCGPPGVFCVFLGLPTVYINFFHVGLCLPPLTVRNTSFQIFFVSFFLLS